LFERHFVVDDKCFHERYVHIFDLRYIHVPILINVLISPIPFSFSRAGSVITPYNVAGAKLLQWQWEIKGQAQLQLEWEKHAERKLELPKEANATLLSAVESVGGLAVTEKARGIYDGSTASHAQELRAVARGAQQRDVAAAAREIRQLSNPEAKQASSTPAAEKTFVPKRIEVTKTAGTGKMVCEAMVSRPREQLQKVDTAHKYVFITTHIYYI
jgi:hypothetical protein